MCIKKLFIYLNNIFFFLAPSFERVKKWLLGINSFFSIIQLLLFKVHFVLIIWLSKWNIRYYKQYTSTDLYNDSAFIGHFRPIIQAFKYIYAISFLWLLCNWTVVEVILV